MLRGRARHLSAFDRMLTCIVSPIHFQLPSKSVKRQAEPAEGPPVPPPSRGLTYAQGPHVRQGKNVLGACRCMTVVV